MIDKNYYINIDNHYQSVQKCPWCQRKNLKSAAGKRPGEESIRCGDCGEFLGYQPVGRLRKRRNQGLEPISAILARMFGGEQ